MTDAPTTRWQAVLTALFAGVVGGCAFGKMSPALPMLKEEFGLSLIEAGWLVSAFNALAAASAIFFGVFCDRIGALRFCIAGALFMAAGGLLGALVYSAPLFIASRFLEGMGFIAVIVSAPGLIVAAAGADRPGLGFGVWVASLSL